MTSLHQSLLLDAGRKETGGFVAGRRGRYRKSWRYSSMEMIEEIHEEGCSVVVSVVVDGEDSSGVEVAAGPESVAIVLARGRPHRKQPPS